MSPHVRGGNRRLVDGSRHIGHVGRPATFGNPGIAAIGKVVHDKGRCGVWYRVFFSPFIRSTPFVMDFRSRSSHCHFRWVRPAAGSKEELGLRGEARFNAGRRRDHQGAWGEDDVR